MWVCGDVGMKTQSGEWGQTHVVFPLRLGASVLREMSPIACSGRHHLDLAMATSTIFVYTDACTSRLPSSWPYSRSVPPAIGDAVPPEGTTSASHPARVR